MNQQTMKTNASSSANAMIPAGQENDPERDLAPDDQQIENGRLRHAPAFSTSVAISTNSTPGRTP